MSKNFDDIICLKDPENCVLTIDKGWGQGRTLFGGVVAAAAFSKLETFKLRDIPVRSLNFIFSSPCSPEKKIDLTANLVSSGKNVEIYSFLASQMSSLVLSGNAVFGKKLNDILTRKIHMPFVPTYKNLDSLPFVEGVTPEFISNFEMRTAKGSAPFTGCRENETANWIRFRNTGDETRLQHILALLDAIPPPVLQMLDDPVPISTISWSIQILNRKFTQRPTDFWLVWCCADFIADGYAHTTAIVFDQSGNAAAVANQTVGVFGKH